MMKVKVTQVGYYGGKRVKPGEILVLTSEDQFSAKWMEKLEEEISELPKKKKKKSEPKPEPEATPDEDVI